MMQTVKLPECLPRPTPVLTREKSAAYLSELGYPMTPQRLAKLAVSGGGPAYRRWGNVAVYRVDDLLAWIDERSGAPLAHTSQTTA